MKHGMQHVDTEANRIYIYDLLFKQPICIELVTLYIKGQRCCENCTDLGNALNSRS